MTTLRRAAPPPSRLPVNENGPRINAWGQNVSGLTIGNYGDTLEFDGPGDATNDWVDYFGPGVDPVDGVFSQVYPGYGAAIQLLEPGQYTIEAHLTAFMNAAPPVDTMGGFITGRISNGGFEQTVESTKPLFPDSMSTFVSVTSHLWVRQGDVDQGQAYIVPHGFYFRTAGTTSYVESYYLSLTIQQLWPGTSSTSYP